MSKAKCLNVDESVSTKAKKKKKEKKSFASFLLVLFPEYYL